MKTGESGRDALSDEQLLLLLFIATGKSISCKFITSLFSSVKEYWVGQKFIHVSCYGKTQTNVLANPIYYLIKT